MNDYKSYYGKQKHERMQIILECVALIKEAELKYDISLKDLFDKLLTIK